MDGLFFLEVTLAGLGSGGLYALAALAFVIVYKATRVVNIAIGEFLMMGAYAFYALPRRRHGLAGLAGHRRRGGGLGLLGAVVERLTIRPMLMDELFFLEVTLAGLGSGGSYALAALAFVIV